MQDGMIVADYGIGIVCEVQICGRGRGGAKRMAEDFHDKVCVEGADASGTSDTEATSEESDESGDEDYDEGPSCPRDGKVRRIVRATSGNRLSALEEPMECDVVDVQIEDCEVAMADVAASHQAESEEDAMQRAIAVKLEENVSVGADIENATTRLAQVRS